MASRGHGRQRRRLGSRHPLRAAEKRPLRVRLTVSAAACTIRGSYSNRLGGWVGRAPVANRGRRRTNAARVVLPAPVASLRGRRQPTRPRRRLSGRFRSLRCKNHSSAPLEIPRMPESVIPRSPIFRGFVFRFFRTSRGDRWQREPPPTAEAPRPRPAQNPPHVSRSSRTQRVLWRSPRPA